VPSSEMKGRCHPTRAAILKHLRRAPARYSDLLEVIDAPRAEVKYHCRALCNCGCIVAVETPESDPEDPLLKVA
jgi:hypothetical protein